jgi:hypothetical protein
MLRKLSLICAVAAAVLFPVPTFAGHGHGGHGGHHGGGHGGHHGGGHGGHRGGHGGYYAYRGGHHGHHHRGHWYHGRYWGYGIGSCWRWTPYGYVWICGY